MSNMNARDGPVKTEDGKNIIIFSDRTKKYSFLSNTYISDIVIDGKTYFHVAGYHHCSKYWEINDKAAEHIRNTLSPMLIKKASDMYKLSVEQEKNWTTNVADGVVRRGIYVKFMTSTELSQKLIDTGDSMLVDNSHDQYWGRGKDGKGNNAIGKILMEVRDILESLDA